jgi:hypothetical protein
MQALETLRTTICKDWLFALRRRSHKHKLPWERFGKICDSWIPKPKIIHPYPNVRFNARYSR